MLVSVNVLTPFSYADVEDFVDNVENIENEVENIEEYEETLPAVEEIINDDQPQGLSWENEIFEDSQSTTSWNILEEEIEDEEEITQSLEALTESGVEVDDIDGWESIYEEENIDELGLQKAQELTTMEVISWTLTTLLPWQEFNATIKKLAGQSGATYSTTNTTINQIIQWTWDMIPSWVITTWISTSDSEKEIIAWYDDGTIYYYTEAETIYMNSDSSYMFDNMRWLNRIDMSGWNASNVTNMGYMFYYCNKITSLNLSGWNTSNVTDMNHMFGYCSSLTGLDLSSFDTSKVTNMNFMFGHCSSFTWLDLSSFDTSKVTDMNFMFGYCRGLIWLDLSSFDTSKVTDMSFMFYYSSNLKTIYVSTWFIVDQVTQDYYMFNSDTNIVWWNLTRYNSSKTDKEYARIDKLWQKWYFTDANAIIVKFMIGWEEYKTQFVGLWEKATKPENPYRTWASFEKWVDKNGEEFDFSAAVDGYTELYAKFSSGWDAILLPWSEFNVKIKQLAWNSGATTYGYINTWIKQIVQWTWNSIPVWVITWVISSSYSENEVIAWFTWWVLYYTTQADIIYLNPDSSRMFYLLRWLTGLDVNKWNTSNVTNMYEMFEDCSNLENLNLNWWDTSNVTNMSYMFYDCDNLTELDLSNWDTSNVTSMNYMFGYCKNLEYLNLNWWDFRWLSSSLQMGNVLRLTSKLTKLDMENTKFTWSMHEAFQWLNIVEEINLSGADTSNVTDMSYMFCNCYNLVEIKWLDTWDTSNVTNMYEMFYYCNNLTEIDVSNFDTSKVTNMGYMFNSCRNLTWLDLSSWDTSNVTSMSSMFYNCTGLLELNLSGWDFSKASSASLVNNIWLQYGAPLKKLNMTNAKFSWSMASAFWGMKDMEELILDWVDTSRVTEMGTMFIYCSSLTNLDLSSFDTSKVTSMGSMFYNCTGLTQLDLSSFDTSHVTDMGSMFHNCTKLGTIYVSTWFVVDQVTSSSSMFSNDTKLVWWNGTVFDSNYTDKEYARIDGRNGLSWYFTYLIRLNFDSNGGTPVNSQKFKAWLTGTKPTDPTKTWNTFLGWYTSDDLEFDFSQPIFEPTQLYAKWQVNQYTITFDTDGWVAMNPIDVNYGDNISVPNPTRNGYRFIGWEPSLPATMPAENLSVKAKWEKNWSSGWWGWWGGGNTKPDTPKEEHKPTDTSEQNSQPDGQASVEPQNDNSNTQDSQLVEQASANASEWQNQQQFTPEFQEAYEFAKWKWITTMPTIQKAQMDGKLTRIAMAKMLSQYAINVLWQTPDTSKTIKFVDVTDKRDADYDNGVTLAYQLWIMWQNMLLYSTSDGEYKSTSKYYIHHMEKLVKEWIITKDDPKMKERRWYVMIMLMRSAK